MFDPDPSPYRAADLDEDYADQAPGRQPPSRRSTLPLGAQPLRTPSGWSIRLRVRAENVWVEKQAHAVEEVTVRLRRVEDLKRRVATLRREELDVSVEGNLETTRPVTPPAAGRGTPLR